MCLGRFLVEAVVVSGASPSKLARAHGISRSWLFPPARPLHAGRLRGGRTSLAPT